MIRTSSIPFLLAGLTALPAQNPCEGDGVGSAYLSTTQAILGGHIDLHMGSPASPNGIGLLLFGNNGGASLPFCLDVNQLFVTELAVLDATGDAHFQLGVLPTVFDAQVFAKPLVWEGTTWSLGKTVRIQTEYEDSYRDVASLSQARSMHTCTALSGDPTDNITGALVAGGATGNLIAPTALASTEVFDTVTRQWLAGPDLSEPRSNHAAVRLSNGSVLITGGMTNAAIGTGGPATASCELYAPGAPIMVPIASMGQARAGHAMTELADGRILVSGGFSDWTDAGSNFIARLDTAQDTSEIYNPGTGLWTAGPTMASKRAGHTQTLLDDGRVLIIGGCNSGTLLSIPPWSTTSVPLFTATCELFDPTTNALTATSPLFLARGFHGASSLPNGEVLVTGGAGNVGFNGEAAATTSCDRWSPTSGTWTPTAPLAIGVAFHTQIRDRDSGDAIIMGGFVDNFGSLTGSSQVVRHDGTLAQQPFEVGQHQVLSQQLSSNGSHAAAQLHDGTILIAGGYGWNGTTFVAKARAMLHVPDTN